MVICLPGVFEDLVFIRYPLDKQDYLKEQYDEVTNFEPQRGRSMKEYIVIPDAIFTDNEMKSDLLDICVKFVSALPPK